MGRQSRKALRLTWTRYSCALEPDWEGRASGTSQLSTQSWARVLSLNICSSLRLTAAVFLTFRLSLPHSVHLFTLRVPHDLSLPRPSKALPLLLALAPVIIQLWSPFILILSTSPNPNGSPGPASLRPPGPVLGHSADKARFIHLWQ